MVTKQPTVPSEPSLEQFGPSAALLPLATDEVLVGVDGGSIVSDGVTVLQHSPFDPRLQLNRQCSEVRKRVVVVLAANEDPTAGRQSRFA